MLRLEISAVSEHNTGCIFIFLSFFLKHLLTFCNRAGNAIGLLCFISIWSRGADTKTKESLYVFMQARLTPPLVLCPCCGVDEGTHKHTPAQKQQANAACDAFCCLLTVYITEPQACFCPASSALHPPRSRRRAFGPTIRQLLGGLPHTWPPGHCEEFPPTHRSITAHSRGRCLCSLPAGGG